MNYESGLVNGCFSSEPECGLASVSRAQGRPGSRGVQSRLGHCQVVKIKKPASGKGPPVAFSPLFLIWSRIQSYQFLTQTVSCSRNEGNFNLCVISSSLQITVILDVSSCEQLVFLNIV